MPNVKLLKGYCSKYNLWIVHTKSKETNKRKLTDLWRNIPHADIKSIANGPASQYSSINPAINRTESAVVDPVLMKVNPKVNTEVNIMATAKDKRVFSSPKAPMKSTDGRAAKIYATSGVAHRRHASPKNICDNVSTREASREP